MQTKLNATTIKQRTFPIRPYSYSERDTMLYALSVGMAQDPQRDQERAFVVEGHLKPVPSQATVIAWDDDWLPAIGLDLTKVVHGEQRITSTNR